MKKLLILSDSHGAVDAMKEVIQRERPFDALFFLGDGYMDLEHIRANVVAIYQAKGNCDYGHILNLGQTSIDGVTLFYTHGHLFGAKHNPSLLIREGLDRGADIVLYGHTHLQALDYEDDPKRPTLFNPGSLRNGNYGVITLKSGTPTFEMKQL